MERRTIDHGSWRVNRAIPTLIADLLIFFRKRVGAQIRCDFAELFEGGFAVVHNFLSELLGIGKVAGVFAALPASRSIGSRLTAGEISIVSPESWSLQTALRAGRRVRRDPKKDLEKIHRHQGAARSLH